MKPWVWTAVIDHKTCDVCAALHQKSLPSDTPWKDLPPHKDCKNPDGCRCMAEKS